MKKFFFGFVVLVILAAFAFSQTENSGKALPPKTGVYPGLALDNKPPSNTIKSYDLMVPPTPTPTPVVVKTPASVAGYQVKEAVQPDSFTEEKLSILLVSTVFLLSGICVVFVIYVHTHKKQRSRAKRVREYKDSKLKKNVGSSHGFDHDSAFH